METTKPTKQPGSGWKRRLAFSAVVSAALAFTLCFFGPLDLYFNNYEELWFHFQDIIGGVAATAGIFFVVTTLIGTLLRGRLHSIYMALMFGGLLGTYVQASFMNKDYGTLNGTSVDWGAYTGYGVVNTIVWAVCILLPLILMLVLKEKKLRPVLIFLSCALILMQGASLVVSYLNYPTVEESPTLTTDGLWELSKQDNTIIFVVDTMDEAYYADMLQRHPEYAKKLQGFTCYNNALAAGARTPVALPLLLTGIPRTMPGTYADYMDYIWNQHTPLDDLRSAGYDIRLFTQARFVSAAAQDLVDNMDMSTSTVGNYSGLNKKLYKLTLYKYVPHFLKWRFWMSTEEFDKFQQENGFVINDVRFYDSYQKHNGFTYIDADKCFRLYHMRGTHKPFNINAKGEHVPDGTSTPEEQIDGLFSMIFHMLDDMKENGVFDSANIFIMADHGDKDMAQWAALLYKPAGSAAAYSVSEAPISFLDVTATLDEIAGGDVTKIGSGRTLADIAEDENRTRSFYINSGNNATLNTDEYQTDSHASEADILKLANQYQLQDVSTAEQYTLGTELSFNVNQSTANLYCTNGFLTPQGGTTTIEGHSAQMVIPIANLPDDGNLTVSLSCRDVLTACNLTISVNGQSLFEKKLEKKSFQSEDFVFPVPVSALQNDTLTLDMTFDGIPESDDEKDPGTRTGAIRVSALTIAAEE